MSATTEETGLNGSPIIPSGEAPDLEQIVSGIDALGEEIADFIQLHGLGEQSPEEETPDVETITGMALDTLSRVDYVALAWDHLEDPSKTHTALSFLSGLGHTVNTDIEPSLAPVFKRAIDLSTTFLEEQGYLREELTDEAIDATELDSSSEEYKRELAGLEGSFLALRSDFIDHFDLDPRDPAHAAFLYGLFGSFGHQSADRLPNDEDEPLTMIDSRYKTIPLSFYGALFVVAQARAKGTLEHIQQVIEERPEPSGPSSNGIDA